MAACQLEATPHSVAVAGTDGGIANVIVVDQTRGVEEAQSGAPRPLLESVVIVKTALDPDDATALFLAWTMFPCERDVEITASLSTGRLHLVVEPEQSEEDCLAMAVAYGMRLSFRSPIDSAMIDAAVVRQGETLEEPPLLD